MSDPDVLTWRDIPLFIALALVHLVVRNAPGAWTSRLFDPCEVSDLEPPDEELPGLLALGRRVQHAAWKLGLRDSCLAESLILQALLKRQGFRAAIRLGAGLVNGQMRAHAWVEIGTTAITINPGFHRLEVE